MTISLSVYGTTTASTTLSTANTVVSTAASPASVNNGTLVGLATGWGELTSQGTASAWAAAGSMGSPTGKGWLFDVITLEGQQIIAGSWNASCRVDKPGSTGNITCTFSMNAYKRSSGGVYTLIGSIQLTTGQVLPNTLTIYNMTAASLSSMNFNTGDKLYLDIWLNISANSTTSSQNINCALASSSTQGLANQSEWDTPGYQLIPSSGTNKFAIRQHHAFGRLQ